MVWFALFAGLCLVVLAVALVRKAIATAVSTTVSVLVLLMATALWLFVFGDEMEVAIDALGLRESLAGPASGLDDAGVADPAVRATGDDGDSTGATGSRANSLEGRRPQPDGRPPPHDDRSR